MRNKSKKIVVTIYCEGKTEENYFKGLLDGESFDKFKFIYNNLKGASYKDTKIKIEKEKSEYTGFKIVILDLDRTTNNSKEKNHLFKLISYFKNNKDHIFLTYKNFEDWLMHHFKDVESIQDLCNKLEYKDVSNMKADTNLYQKISKKGGDIGNAEKYFKNITPFYFCNQGGFYIRQEFINTIQSNLFYFREYLKSLHVR